MQEEIRLLKGEEREELERFLERAYGHGRGFFPRNYPNLWPQATECSLIIKSQGEIVGHVGTYPLKLVIGPTTILAGAIGGVAAAPKARGRGYMSSLMESSLEIMAEKKMPLSVLWGDRQRYNHFGYETCGQKYYLELNRRSLERAGAKPADVREVDPEDPAVLAEVQRLHSTLICRVERNFFQLLLTRPGVRVFMGDGGYLISRGEYSGDLVLQEVVSPTGREPELVLGAMNWAFAQKASLELETISTPAQRRLYEASNYWTAAPQGMFRIINWPDLCQALAPYFAQVAKGLPAFELAIGCTWHGETQVATISWDSAKFTTSQGRVADKYVELEAPELAGALWGGPFERRSLGLFGKLLPVPVHIPNIDHV